jgi:hypothetical protein
VPLTALWKEVAPFAGPVLGAIVGGGITVAYNVWHNRTKAKPAQSDMEAALLEDLPKVNATQSELWAAIPSQEHDLIVELYVKRPITHGRANLVFDYWNRVGQMYQERQVDCKRFLPRIAPDCNATWNNFSLLIAYFEVTQPARIADFKRLQKAVTRDIERNRKRLDRLAKGAPQDV